MTSSKLVLQWAAAGLMAAAWACVSARADAGVDTGAGMAMPPPAAVVARRTHRLVYCCREASVPVFSDRPCGEAALLRSLEVYTPAQSGQAPSTQPAQPRASTKPAHGEALAKTLQESAEKCGRLQKSLDDVDDRMRAGYPAREAARLWQRWRDARAAVREAGC